MSRRWRPVGRSAALIFLVVPVCGSGWGGVPKPAAGAAGPGLSVSWSSSNGVAATVDGPGLVTARAAGTATITARVDGTVGSVSPEVVAQPVAQVAVTPSFSVLNTGANALLRGAALSATGDTVRSATFEWRGLTPAAAVNASGRLSGVTPGVGLVELLAEGAVDTAAVAVLGSRSLLASALPGGAYRSDVRVGQRVAVPVALDLSRVGATGDLGSAQFDLLYDPAVLRLDSVTVGVRGSADTHVPAPGRVRFAFAGTREQGAPRLTLATAHFTVAPGAAEGLQRAFSLEMPVAPTDGSFRAYERPIVVSGRVRVVK